MLNETPQEELQSALSKMLDLEETLKFLALDVALVNSDGYWTRASDYYLFRDAEGVFQLFPHDMNEAFSGSRGGPPGGRRGQRNRRGPREGERPGEERFRDEGPRRERGDDERGRAGPPEGFPLPGGRPPEGFGPPPGFGPGGRRGPGGPGQGSVDLDPLVGSDNERMPLRSQLLSIPALRDQYLEVMRSIATDALDWEKLGPFVESQHQLIDEAMQRDTKKLASYEQFSEAVEKLREFAQKRQEYLLNYKVSTSAGSLTRGELLGEADDFRTLKIQGSSGYDGAILLGFADDR